jgi:hypothetical protein
MTPLLLALSLLVGPPTASVFQQPQAPLRVHVKTDTGGLPEDLAARRESVAQLAAALNAQKKGKAFVVVPEAEAADIEVIVMGRSVTVPKVVFGVGAMPQPGRPSSLPPPTRRVALTVVVAPAGEDPVEVTSKNLANESPSGWKSVAEDVAKQIDKWAADRRKELTRRVTSRPGPHSSREEWSPHPRHSSPS